MESDVFRTRTHLIPKGKGWNQKWLQESVTISLLIVDTLFATHSYYQGETACQWHQSLVSRLHHFLLSLLFSGPPKFRKPDPHWVRGTVRMQMDAGGTCAKQGRKRGLGQRNRIFRYETEWNKGLCVGFTGGFSQSGLTPEQAFMKYGSILSTSREIRVIKIAYQTCHPMGTMISKTIPTCSCRTRKLS